MANIPVPVFRVNGTNAIVVFLYVFALFGSMHLLAIAKPNARLSQAYLALGF